MKKIIITIGIICAFLSFIPNGSQAYALNDPSPTATELAPDPEMEAKVLLSRLDEINLMDKSNLNLSQKRELKKEVMQIKAKLHEVKGGVYLSAGAIIIILLLIIILA